MDEGLGVGDGGLGVGEGIGEAVGVGGKIVES